MFNDHSPVHVKMLANRALKLLRMLVLRGVDPSIKANYGMVIEDGEMVVALASILHDLGMAVVHDDHEVYDVPLALGFSTDSCRPATDQMRRQSWHQRFSTRLSATTRHGDF